ncbi:MAG: helicase-related protein, partial [Chloroflexota bacterium]|nr:helicase-related protein [Chloroflexota bacterium]
FFSILLVYLLFNYLLALTGINLQDANVVINYDLAWTPDVIIQRAGRIMRFWKEPRQVHIYAFVGVFEEDDPVLPYDASGVSRQLESLTARSNEAQEIVEIPILPEDEHQRITSLGIFSRVTLADLGELDATEVEDYSGGSPFLKHITAMIQNQQLVDNLRDDISSAKQYEGEHEIVYLLIRHQDEFEWLVFNVSLNQSEEWSNDKLFEAIACDADESVAVVDKETLETVAQSMRNDWCKRNSVRPNEVERICAMYLKPRNNEDSLNDLVRINAVA